MTAPQPNRRLQNLPQPTVDALDAMERTVVGNDALIRHPNVAAALNDAGATAAQAGIVSQYLDGMRVGQMVNQYRSSGMTDPLQLSDSQQRAAAALNIDLTGVVETKQSLFEKQSKQITDQGMVPLVSNGQVVGSRPKTGAEVKHDGWFDSFGGFFHHVTHNPVTDGASEGWNVIDNGVAGGAQDIIQIFNGPATGNSNQLSDEQKHIYQALGYDGSVFSKLALEAKGLDVGDVSKLVRDHGLDRVTEAAVYAKDPAAYMQKIADESTSPEEAAKRIQDVSSNDFQQLVQQYSGARPTIGHSIARLQLNIENAAAGGNVLASIASAAQAPYMGFETVANAIHPGKGGQTQHGAHYDPTLDAKFNSYSGSIDFAASMVLDPTLVLGKLAKATKIASAGMDSLQDVGRFQQIMTTGTGLAAKRAQAGLQNAVENANAIHAADVAMQAAHDAGNADEIVKTTAAWRAAHQRFDAGSAVYTPIKDQLLGKNQFVKYGSEGERVVADGEHLNTYNKALSYLVDQQQVSQLAAGKAARELPYAPGALSSVTVTKIRQALAGGRAEKRAIIDLSKPQAAAKVLPFDDAQELRTGLTLTARQQTASTAERVAGLQSQLDSVEKSILDFKPGAASDGVKLDALQSQKDHLTQSLSLATKEHEAATSNFASAQRAAQGAIDKAGEQLGIAAVGDAQFAARGGSEADRSFFQGGLSGLVSPSALAERMRLVGRRMPWVQLPRHNSVDITVQSDREGVIGLAKTYLSRPQVDAISALWDSGDLGVRRNLVQSTNLQVAHAAGLGYTKAGRELMERLFKDDPQLYATNGHSTVAFDPMTGKPNAAFAVLPGQVRTSYRIADFKQLHQAAAKVGLFESMMGKAFTSKTFDKLFNVLRFGMLAVPRTVPRNTIDTRMMMASRGLTHDMISAKAWLADNGAIPERHVLSRLGMENLVTKRIGDAYRTVLKNGLETDKNYLDEVKQFFPHDFELAKSALTVGRRSDINVDDAAAEAASLLEDGFNPAKLKYGRSGFERNGYEEFEPAGKGGADRWSDSLGVAMYRTPELTKKIVRYLEATPESRVTAFDDVLAEMRNPETAMWVKQMEHTHIVTDAADSIPRVAVTEADKADALTQLAWKSIHTMHDMLTSAKGEWIQPVADHLKNGHIPEGDWIRKNLPNLEDRPKKVIGPSYAPKVLDEADAGAVGRQKLAEGLQDVTGKFYQRVVEDQIGRTVTLPAYWAFYQKARTAGADAERRLVDAGMTEDAARAALHHRALTEARHRVTDFIDDPALRSQFDIVNRNLVMFPRASMQFMNRLWQMEKYDPTVIRKWFLGLNGAENSGLVYKDQHGELTYTVPGTEVLTEALTKIGQTLGIPDLAMVPVTSTLSGKVALSVPGYNNPFQMGMSPMVNVPLRYLSHLAPQHALLIHEVDQFLNGGSQGAGQSALDTVIPGSFKRFWDAMNPDQRDGMVASSTRDALANLYAADPNGTKGIFPAGAAQGSKELQQFVDRVNTHTKNQFWVRAFTALFSPAAPSRPGEQVKGVTDKPDASYYAVGVRNMQDEFRMLLNQYHGDYGTALQTWTVLHPDMLIYAAPTTQVTTPGVNIPATKGFEKWVEANQAFIKKYPSTWAHFAPDIKGAFDPIANQTQLDIGIRKHLTPEEFIGKYQLQRQVNGFFAKDDQKKQDVADAMRSGDILHVQQLKADYRNQSNAYLAANPLVQGVLNAGPEVQLQASNALHDLRQMVGDRSAPLQNRSGVAEMLRIYDQFTQSIDSNSGVGSSGRSAMLKQQLTNQLVDLVQADPELKSIYNGVFRKLNIGVKSLASQLAVGG